ncbi:MAG: hypothetical protein ACOCXM_00475 [Myxococcota bacterium]
MPPHSTHAWIDDREAPVYVVTYPDERSDDQVREAHAAIERIYRETDEPVAWVVDASRMRWSPATQRRIVAEHEKRVRPFAERWASGLALVITNDFVRGLFTAVTWMAPLKYPYKMFADRTSAIGWARAQLRLRRESA